MNPIFNCLLTSHRYANVKCFAEGDINDNAEMVYPFKKADVNKSTFSGRTYFNTALPESC